MYEEYGRGSSGVSADGHPEPPHKKANTADNQKERVRMLELTIKIARVLIAFPTVHKRLRIMEQRWGRECLSDDPAKLV